MHGSVVVFCLLLLVSSCAKSPTPYIQLDDLTNIPITSDHELTMDSSTVLVDEKLLLKEHWTDAEKILLWEILEKLTPISDVPDPLSPLLGCALSLNAKRDNQEVVIKFYEQRCIMTVKKNALVEKTQWFTYSAEDYQKLKKLIYP